MNTEEPLQPDMDAVYVATREEVKSWADENGIRTTFPAGTDGIRRINPLMQLQV
jgi:hypothetical protein